MSSILRRPGSTPARTGANWSSCCRRCAAIALLTLICIASVIGTVVSSTSPTAATSTSSARSGPVFGTVGLYSVYSAWWFLLMLGFLVVSTSLCIARNTPKVLQELRSPREPPRDSLAAFHHKLQVHWALAPQARCGARPPCWPARLDGTRPGARQRHHGGGARGPGAQAGLPGGALGHRADLPGWPARWRLDRAGPNGARRQGGLPRCRADQDVPAQRVLSPTNPSFRGSLLVPEGARAGTSVLSLSDGIVLQPLPFDVELRKFIVEYYDTGMPGCSPARW
ncbi:MAG: cytochrome c biogenesis protein ResB [Ideonella sp.]|nr:cytochrome c biogenesis protein ResB [Ideonella sp.]